MRRKVPTWVTSFKVRGTTGWAATEKENQTICATENMLKADAIQSKLLKI